MPTKLKSATARRNGTRSRGPITDEGKRIASRNAVKHGIHSSQIVLQHENAELYDGLLAAYLDEWQPATPTEEALVLDLVNARWRLQRRQQLATAALEREIEDYKEHAGRKHKTMTPAAICVRAHERNVPKGTLESFERLEARLHRLYHRSLKVLRSLQAERFAAEAAQIENCQNEPTSAEDPSNEPLTSEGSSSGTQSSTPEPSPDRPCSPQGPPQPPPGTSTEAEPEP